MIPEHKPTHVTLSDVRIGQVKSVKFPPRACDYPATGNLIFWPFESQRMPEGSLKYFQKDRTALERGTATASRGAEERKGRSGTPTNTSQKQFLLNRLLSYS